MRQTLTSPRGMATAPHHLAASSAAAVLREGGNAIEAMVAAAATIAVVYPHMNSIGGDGFWIISEPGQEPVAIDACGRAAGLASMAWYREQGVTGSVIPGRGPLAANTVAGAISGWQEALLHSTRMGGKLPVSRLLQDAIDYANNGAPVTQSQVNFTSKFLPELGTQPGFAKQFLNDDTYGHHVPLVNTLRTYAALGQTLQALSDKGLDDFYRGAIAASNAAQLEALGSPLRLADFHAHRAQSVKPLSVKITDATLYNLTPPTQGLASLMILAIFDKLRIRHGIKEAEGFAYLHAIVEATKQAFKVRNRYIADPATMTAHGVSPEQFLTDRFIDQCANAVDMKKALPWPEKTIHGDTIWMGTADSGGRMVSYIQSVYWEFGSGVVLSDTGVGWQNRGSSFLLDSASHLALAPHKKPFHTLNPAHARFDDGRTMVYGNMGGDGQPQSQSAVFSRYAMFGQTLQAAVSAPRWLLGKTWGQESTTLKFENRFDSAMMQSLANAGHEVEMLPDYSDTMGHAGAIVRQPDGLYLGAADPRSDGVVSGF
ncbi:MAG: gamma-glutamyltransferase [Cytophagales bacterium]|nr:gamma-glutamyltransferase [Cytophagales bacterium]